MISLIWFGTNSIKITSNKESILFDPFIRFDKRNDKSFINNFKNTKNIFITHGHMDHSMDLSTIYKNENVKIHCTKSPYNRLKNEISINNLKLIKPGDVFNLDDIKIKVYKGKHIKFDLKLIIETLFNKNVIKYRKNLPILIKNHIKCKENNETVIYYINIERKKLLLMGSMALDEKTTYPKDIDYLILAYQGRSDLDKKINNIINRIKPKNIILSHFDDSFPPISKKVDINSLNYIIDKNINLIVPEHDKKIILK